LRVTLKNFQSFKEADLDIKGFTVLIGRNNLGKSAISRAIRSVIRNRGDFTRLNSKSSTVTLNIADNSISRIKGKSIDYEINGKQYKSIGREIPQELVDLGFKPIFFGTERVFVQVPNQFEKIFLIDQPNTVIAETVSKISKIDVINKALKLVNRDRKRDEATLKIRKLDLDKVRTDIEKFRRIDELRIKSKEILNLKNKIESLQNSLLEISEFTKNLKISSNIIEILGRQKDLSLPDLSSIIEGYREFEILESLSSQYQERLDSVSGLEKISAVEEINFPEDQVRSFDFIKQSFGDLHQLKLRITKLKRVESIVAFDSSFVDLFDEFSNLERLLEDFTKFSSEINCIEKSLLEVQNNLEDLSKEIVTIKETNECPFREVFGCKSSW